MTDAIHTETIDQFTIEIHIDTDSESPEEMGNESLFALFFDRSPHIVREGFPTSFAILRYSDGSGFVRGSGRQLWKHKDKTYHVFPFFGSLETSQPFMNLHDNGGHAMGMVFASTEYWETRNEAETAAKGLVEEWASYFRGERYGYTISQKNVCEHCLVDNPDFVDSVWGYDDVDFCLQEAKDAVKHTPKRKQRLTLIEINQRIGQATTYAEEVIESLNDRGITADADLYVHHRLEAIKTLLEQIKEAQ